VHLRGPDGRRPVREAPFEQAVVCADAALRAGLERPRSTPRCVGPAGGRACLPPGARPRSATVGSESVGESRSRVAIALARLPTPTLQWPVPYGGSTAYTDFGWSRQRTVGEFDGKVKYGRALRPGQDVGEVVYAEKLREDAIRSEDWEVVRWTWADLRDFGPTAARIRSRFRTV
jgi:hypothetical protein